MAPAEKASKPDHFYDGKDIYLLVQAEACRFNLSQVHDSILPTPVSTASRDAATYQDIVAQPRVARAVLVLSRSKFVTTPRDIFNEHILAFYIFSIRLIAVFFLSVNLLYD